MGKLLFVHGLKTNNQAIYLIVAVACSCKIDKQKLLAFIENKPDAELYEIASLFDCSSVAVFKILKRINMTFKKDHRLL